MSTTTKQSMPSPAACSKVQALGIGWYGSRSDLGSMLEIASKYAQADDDARDEEGAADLAIARRSSTKRKPPQDGGTSNEVAAAFEGKGGKRKWKAKGKDVALAKARLDYESIRSEERRVGKEC